MKKILSLSILLALSFCAVCQTAATNYPGDVEKAFGRIRTGAYKNGYNHLITFSNVHEAAINVQPGTQYLLFFVYDNTKNPVTDFKVFLMTPDSVLRKKYTARPFDRGQVGVARGEQLQFTTPAFAKGETRPVKIEANPKATVYVFLKK